MGAVNSIIFGGEEDTRKYMVKQDSENLWSIANVVDPEIETADSEELITQFSHEVVHDDLADFVDISIQRLRVLRHPNVLKFLSSYASDETVYLLTELVSPVEVVIKNLGHDEAIKGLRDIARGLQFLHEKAMLSHNNLHTGIIFVREATWCWKIGGFECALELKRVDAKFLEDISLIRKPSVIPPEDKVKGFSNVSKSPPYARDMWAFGQLVVAIVTKMESNSDDRLMDHTKSCLLNDDPERRITAGQVLRKPWLRNELTDIVEFLEQLTMKKLAEKAEFFKSLPRRLLTLSSQILCRHVIPLLLTPLAMGEPTARKHLWKHIFTPVTGDRSRHFNPEEVCPLITDSDYRRYVSPHIIRLLESREGHIRQILLENLNGFTSVCTDEDMETIVLPQVLVGLQESDDELVAATLQGLSTMVPLLGADVVMGTARRSIFMKTRPKPHCDKDDDVPTSNMPFIAHMDEEPSIIQPVSVAPLLSASELRQKENEARREAMRNKKKTAVGKIGTKAASISEDDRTASVSRDSCSTTEVTATAVEEGYTSNEDSMSHNATNDMDEDFRAWEDEQNFDEDKEQSIKSSLSYTNSLNSPTDYDNWNKSEWPSIEPQTSSWERTTDDIPVTSSSKLSTGSTNGASAFNCNRSNSLLKKTATSSKNSLSATESDSSLKGRLNQSDIERLEEQAKWASMEVDYFADMQPVIANSKPPPSVSPSVSKQMNKSTSSEPTPVVTTNKLNYVPDEESTEGWNDDFDEWDNNDS